MRMRCVFLCVLLVCSCCMFFLCVLVVCSCGCCVVGWMEVGWVGSPSHIIAHTIHGAHAQVSILFLVSLV